MFQTPEIDEKIHYFPAFALTWSLNWGRITNGERVIEELSAGLEFDLLPPPEDDFTKKYVTPVVL